MFVDDDRGWGFGGVDDAGRRGKGSGRRERAKPRSDRGATEREGAVRAEGTETDGFERCKVRARGEVWIRGRRGDWEGVVGD